jgi:ubiquinol-cytochrome c reductase cytochrome b subunit/cytochrome b6
MVEQSKFKEWLTQRLPVSVGELMEVINEPVPKVMEPFAWAAGGIPMFLFGIQAITGVLLAFNYVPTLAGSYQSVARITEVLPFGWWIRGVHHWAANLMILSVFVHMIRTLIFGGFRRPREFTWILGVALLLVTVSFGFTGYSLIGNQLSYWATVIGSNIAGSVPVIGPYLLYFLLGGWDVTNTTITRFYALHAWILPAISTGLVGLHVVLVRLHGPSRPDPEDRHDIRFWPDQVFSEGIVVMFLLLTLVVLATVLPPGTGQLPTPGETPSHIAPEWYFLWVYGFLKLVPEAVGMVALGLFVVVLILWPWVDRLLARISPRLELNPALGLVVGLAIVGLTLWQAFSH